MSDKARDPRLWVGYVCSCTMPIGFREQVGLAGDSHSDVRGRALRAAFGVWLQPARDRRPAGRGRGVQRARLLRFAFRAEKYRSQLLYAKMFCQHFGIFVAPTTDRAPTTFWLSSTKDRGPCRSSRVSKPPGGEPVQGRGAAEARGVDSFLISSAV